MTEAPDGARARVELRGFQDGDEAALAAALSQTAWSPHSESQWLRRIDHWWDHNPAWTPEWERGWVLVERTEGIVGFLGSIPRFVHSEGKRGRSANATTWWVAPEHRKRSLELLAQFSKQPALGHFNTTAAPGTHAAMEAFGYRAFLIDEDHHESWLIVDPVQVAKARVGAKLGRRSRGLTPRRRAGGAGRLARVARSMARIRLPEAPAPYRAAVLPAADDRFANLDRAMSRHDFTAGRDRSSVDWWLGGEPSEHKLLAVCERDGEIAGLGLFLERESATLPVSVFDCVDLAFDRPDRDIVATILRAAVEESLRLGVAAIVVRHFDGFIAEACRELGLVRRGEPPRRDFARLPDGLPPRGHYLTRFHGDFAV